MGVARRIAQLYEIKMNAVLDRAEDPREMLDYSYVQLQDLLAEVRRGPADIAASRSRAQTHVSMLARAADRLQEQAEQAVTAGREDLAVQALARRETILAQVSELRDQQSTLRAGEDQLTAAARGLQAKIEAFRRQKQTIKATYTAARAQASIAEVFAAISDEVGDAAVATGRAEDEAAAMQARASALNGLLTSDALGDGAAALNDEQLQAQLDAISTQAAVEEELARIKERLALGGAKRRMPAPAQGAEAGAEHG